MSRYDCVRCGACCCNTPENRAEGFTDYVEVDARAPLLQRPELARRHVVYNEDGVPHLRLHPDGRCLALRGRLGQQVRCTIYADRPQEKRRREHSQASAHAAPAPCDGQHNPTILGLDPASGATLWQQPDLAATISAHLFVAGTDPGGTLCWLADAAQMVVFACASGTTRWRLRLGEAESLAYTGVTWHKGQLLVQHRNTTRTQVSLHDAAGGARRWQQHLPADRMVLPLGEGPPPYAYGGPPVAAYVLVAPSSGTRRGEIGVAPTKQVLRRAPGGEYLRLGGDQFAEFTREGKPIRERTLVSDHVTVVTATHLVDARPDLLRVLRRDTLQPVLTLPGIWVAMPTQTLGPSTLVLTEHRGTEPGRVLLLRP